MQAVISCFEGQYFLRLGHSTQADPMSATHRCKKPLSFSPSAGVYGGAVDRACSSHPRASHASKEAVALQFSSFARNLWYIRGLTGLSDQPAYHASRCGAMRCRLRFEGSTSRLPRPQRPSRRRRSPPCTETTWRPGIALVNVRFPRLVCPCS